MYYCKNVKIVWGRMNRFLLYPLRVISIYLNEKKYVYSEVFIFFIFIKMTVRFIVNDLLIGRGRVQCSTFTNPNIRREFSRVWISLLLVWVWWEQCREIWKRAGEASRDYKINPTECFLHLAGVLTNYCVVVSCVTIALHCSLCSEFKHHFVLHWCSIK